MNDNTRNEFASFGLEILKKSALLVLYALRDEKLFVRQDEIRERLGIPKIDYSYDQARHNALIFGILMHLKDDGYAYHNSGYGWQITPEGVSVIEG